MTSLRRVLLASILGGLLIVLAISGIVTYAVARSSLRDQHDRALIARARTFAALIIEEVFDPTDPGEPVGLAFDYAGPLSESDLGVHLQISGDDGDAIVQSTFWPSRGAGARRPTLGGEPVVTDLTLADGSGARAVAILVHATRDPDDVAAHGGPPNSTRTALVEVIGRTAPVARAESAVLGALAAGGLLALAGAAGAVWFGVRRGLAPVRRLGTTLDGLGPAQLALPAGGEPSAEELRPITSAVERLLRRMRAAIERERRFTDAAAHELRTPIAELRTIADVAGRWPEPDRLKHAVAEARAIAAEMEALLDALLTAARGGEAAAQPREPIALLPLARSVANGRPQKLRARGVSWAFEGDETARWTAPRGAVLAIVRNLIDNAAEYTPDGGSIRVRVTANGAGTVLEVENGPVALRPGDTEKMFEPFWRADDSRTDRNHRGLGLSIVAALGDALRLRRQAAITPQHRLRISLTA